MANGKHGADKPEAATGCKASNKRVFNSITLLEVPAQSCNHGSQYSAEKLSRPFKKKQKQKNQLPLHIASWLAEVRRDGGPGAPDGTVPNPSGAGPKALWEAEALLHKINKY